MPDPAPADPMPDDPAPEMPYDRSGEVPLERVDELLRDHWGLSGQVFPVEETRGAGFLVDNGNLRYLLEIRETGDEAQLRLEHEVMRHVIRNPDGPPVPEPVATKDGADILTAEIDGRDRLLRLLTALDGDPPPLPGELSPDAIAALGALTAGLAKSLEDFDLRMWNGDREDDLRKAGPQTVSLLSEVTDQQARDLIARAMVAALRRIHPLTQGFRLGLTVPDLPFGDLAGQGTGHAWMPAGISDLTSLSRSWYVAALAKTCAHILARCHGDPSSILPAVTAYHGVNSLNASEAEALWPLVIAQLALEAATTENRHARAADDAAARTAAEACRAVLNAALSIDPAYMHARILDACGMHVPLPEFAPLLPGIDPDRIRLVDLGVTSPLFYDGNWTDLDCDWKLLARVAWDTGMGSTRYGENRLSRSRPDAGAQAETFALHVDICLPVGTPVHAPFDGTLFQAAPQLSFRGEAVTLLVEGVGTQLPEGAKVASGDLLGTVAGEEGSVGGLRLRLARDAENPPPLFCAPSEAPVWRHLAPSPAGLLGLDLDAAPATEDRTTRGWREFLYDEAGRVRLDFSGRAPLIGHGHPSVATAAYRRHLLSAATDSGQREALALVQALAAIAPAGLESVVLFASQRSAMEALVGFARQHTGRQWIVTFESDESAGERREPDGDDGDDGGGDIAAVIFEPSIGTRDLAAEAAAAAQSGGLVIADERRTGYGRLGDVTWAVGRETVPADMLLAGSCDGGSLAVVFCRPELADALETFAQPVSPVDAATGLAALSVLRGEDMQANVAATGAILGEGLRSIAEEAEGALEIGGSGLLWTIQPSSELLDLVERLESDVLHDLDAPGRLLLAPPLCLRETSARLYLDRLRRALGLASD